MSELDRIVERLQAIAAELRNPEVDDAAASELAREAAELVAQAGNELDRPAGH